MALEDRELVAQYLEGDESAFELLVKRHLDHVYSFVARLIGSRDDAADIVQDVFVKVWNNLRHFRQSEQFKPWLMRIARNSAIDWQRKKKSVAFSKFETDDGDNIFLDTLEDHEELPDEIAAKAEESRELLTLLDTLPQRERELLLLYYEEEMTFDQISSLTGEPLNTVKSRVRRTLIKLRQLFMHQRSERERSKK